MPLYLKFRLAVHDYSPRDTLYKFSRFGNPGVPFIAAQKAIQ